MSQGNESLDQAIARTAKASEKLTDALIQHVQNKRKEALEQGDDIAAYSWGDKLFGEIWAKLNDVGLVGNNRPYGVFGFAQAIERLTLELDLEGWQSVHKGAHYYNMGLAYISRMEIDRAFKLFLLADEEDEKNKRTKPGQLFRSKAIFTELRNRFFSPWFRATDSFFHDTRNIEERMDLFGRVISAQPGRYPLSRCYLGLFRACLLWHQRNSSLPPVLAEYLMAIEDLGVFTEGISRMLYEGRSPYQNQVMFNRMLQGGTPLAAIGFSVSALPGMDLSNDETGCRQRIQDALGGDKPSLAKVVQTFRNTMAHATDFPGWLLDPVVLQNVIRVQLDFISLVAEEFENQHTPLWTEPTPASAPPVTSNLQTPLSGAAPPASAAGLTFDLSNPSVPAASTPLHNISGSDFGTKK